MKHKIYSLNLLRKDEYCLKIAKDLSCNIAYFSLDENNETALRLAKEGKIVAVYENGFITIKKGEWKIRVEKATQVPLTLGGKAKFMIANVLAATLAAYLQGFKTEDISLSLQTFIPSAAQTPGRMNIFDFNKEVYGESLKVEFIERVRSEKKFTSLDELKHQISLDQQTIRAILKS